MSKIKGDQSVSRNLQTRNLTITKTTTTTASGTLSLTNFSPSTQIFTGSTAGQIVQLGDATTYLNAGILYFFVNDSTQTVTINDHGSNLLLSLLKNVSALFYLDDKSTANGTWRYSLFTDKTSSTGGSGVTPPFIFGNSSSSLSVGSYLQSGSVPGNKTGQLVPGSNKIVKIAASNASNMSGTGMTFQVQKRTGLTTFADVAGASVQITSGNYKATNTGLSIAIGPDDEISVYLKSGTGTNPNAAIVTVFLVPA